MSPCGVQLRQRLWRSLRLSALPTRAFQGALLALLCVLSSTHPGQEGLGGVWWRVWDRSPELTQQLWLGLGLQGPPLSGHTARPGPAPEGVTVSGWLAQQTDRVQAWSTTGGRDTYKIHFTLKKIDSRGSIGTLFYVFIPALQTFSYTIIWNFL